MSHRQRWQDPDYLLKKQYRGPDNLSARIHLHERFSTNAQGLHRWILQTARALLPERLALLEVGCGEGRLWSVGPEIVPQGWELTLTDFSPGMLAAAEDHISEIYPEQVRFRIADVQALPFPDSAFDAVFAHFVMHHVPDRPKALREIARVLRPGGRVFVSTLGREHIVEIVHYAMHLEGGADIARWERPFRLDNAPEELEAMFEDVRLFEYEDGLLVDEVEPLVAYVLSATDPAFHIPDRIKALRARIAADMAARGPLEIAKQTGMFVCRKQGEAGDGG